MKHGFYIQFQSVFRPCRSLGIAIDARRLPHSLCERGRNAVSGGEAIDEDSETLINPEWYSV